MFSTPRPTPCVGLSLFDSTVPTSFPYQRTAVFAILAPHTTKVSTYLLKINQCRGNSVLRKIFTSSFCPWNSNFFGIMNAVWLNSKNRCLSTPESIAETIKLVASRPACMEWIRPSSADVCIFKAFVTQWWNPKSIQSIRSDKSSTKYLCTVLLVASKHSRYSLRAFNAFNLASKYLFFLWKIYSKRFEYNSITKTLSEKKKWLLFELLSR